MSELKDRLTQVAKDRKTSLSAMERECGLAVGSLTKLGEGMNSANLCKILLRYPEVNANWLVTGMGNPLLDNNTQGYQNEIDSLRHHLEKVEGERKDLLRRIKDLEEERSSLIIVTKQQTELIYRLSNNK